MNKASGAGRLLLDGLRLIALYDRGYCSLKLSGHIVQAVFIHFADHRADDGASISAGIGLAEGAQNLELLPELCTPVFSALTDRDLHRCQRAVPFRRSNEPPKLAV